MAHATASVGLAATVTLSRPLSDAPMLCPDVSRALPTEASASTWPSNTETRAAVHASATSNSVPSTVALTNGVSTRKRRGKRDVK